MDDLIQKYESVIEFEKKKAKQNRMTRAILAMARRIQLHIELRATSPAFYAEQHRTVERREKFYNCFVLDEELEGEDPIIPAFECDFIRD